MYITEEEKKGEKTAKKEEKRGNTSFPYTGCVTRKYSRNCVTDKNSRLRDLIWLLYSDNFHLVSVENNNKILIVWSYGIYYFLGKTSIDFLLFYVISICKHLTSNLYVGVKSPT